MVITLVAVAVLLVLSAFFSGSEAALFSIPEWRTKEQPGVGRLLKNPERLLGTLLFGNLLVNTSATALFTLFLIYLSRRTGITTAGLLGAGGLVMTVVILVLGEVSPKVFASRHPDRFARAVAPFVIAIEWLFLPVTALLERMHRLFGFLPSEPAQLSDEELHTMITVGREKGVLLPGEEEILYNLIGLDRRTVSEVMTPHSDIVAVSETTTVAQALQIGADAGFSRLPVYQDSIDRITGVVYLKELLVAPDPAAPVKSIARPPQFVPEVKRLLPLLDELRRRGSHIAIVVDEFGQTAGLVTLEDLLEAIFGEIADEFDRAEDAPYRKLSEGRFLVDGEIDIVTLNRLLGNAFQGVEHERLSAFIYDRLGRLPRVGDRLEFQGLEMQLVEVSERKLEKVLIVRKGR